jgi:hypothetical protein
MNFYYVLKIIVRAAEVFVNGINVQEFVLTPSAFSITAIRVGGF